MVRIDIRRENIRNINSKRKNTLTKIEEYIAILLSIRD
jgi:hypothetical protein